MNRYDPNLAFIGLFKIANGRPGNLNVGSTVTDTDVAVETIEFKKIFNNALKPTDFAHSPFTARTMDMTNYYVSTVKLEMNDMAILMPRHFSLSCGHLTPDKLREKAPTSEGARREHYPTGSVSRGKTLNAIELAPVESGQEEDDEVLYCMECGQPLTRRDDKCPWCGEYQ